MIIKNINESYGEPVIFDGIDEMAQAIKDCGYELPGDGLKEGRDYEIVITKKEAHKIPANTFSQILDFFKMSQIKLILLIGSTLGVMSIFLVRCNQKQLQQDTSSGKYVEIRQNVILVDNRMLIESLLRIRKDEKVIVELKEANTATNLIYDVNILNQIYSNHYKELLPTFLMFKTNPDLLNHPIWESKVIH